MSNLGKHVGFWVSLVLFLIVVPYSLYEWFDGRLPFSPSLYLLSGVSALLLAYNIYVLKRKD